MVKLPTRYSFTLVKRDGKWLIVDHHSAALPKYRFPPLVPPRIARGILRLNPGNGPARRQGASRTTLMRRASPPLPQRDQEAHAEVQS